MKGRTGGSRAKSSAASPFVRNVNLKFNDIGFDQDLSDLSVPLADKTEEEEQILAMLDKASESVSQGKEEKTETEQKPDNSAEEALRIAVEYYMRKARKYQDAPVCPPCETEDDNGNDFINLIKPRRVGPVDLTEDKK